MAKEIVLFDFDGVIADSFSLAFEINKIICPALTERDYRKRFEGNINDWDKVIQGHTDKCRHDIDFFSEYVPRMKNEVGIFPGMAQVVKQLARQYTLIVISSTITGPIKELMEKYNLADYFTEIMGNDVEASKIAKIKAVLTNYNAKPRQCVFVTDTLGDMREAGAVGVGSIGVTWGFCKYKTLLEGKPFQIVRKPGKLQSAVSAYFSKLNTKIKTPS